MKKTICEDCKKEKTCEIKTSGRIIKCPFIEKKDETKKHSPA
jgi:hypothetical protein